MISTRYLKGKSLMHTHTTKFRPVLKNLIIITNFLLPSQSIDLIFQHCGDYIDPEYKPNTRAKYYLSLQFPHVHGGIVIGVFAVRAETTFLGFLSGSFQETEDTGCSIRCIIQSAAGIALYM